MPVRTSLASGFSLRALLMLARCGAVSPKAARAAMEPAVILWWRKKVRRGAPRWETCGAPVPTVRIVQWYAGGVHQVSARWGVGGWCDFMHVGNLQNRGSSNRQQGQMNFFHCYVLHQLYLGDLAAVDLPLVECRFQCYLRIDKRETDSWHLYTLTIALSRWPWPKREFKLVMSGQFRTLALFLLVVEGKRTVVGGWQAGRGICIGGGGARRQDCLTGLFLNPDVAVLFSLNPTRSLCCIEDKFQNLLEPRPHI